MSEWIRRLDKFGFSYELTPTIKQAGEPVKQANCYSTRVPCYVSGVGLPLLPGWHLTASRLDWTESADGVHL